MVATVISAEDSETLGFQNLTQTPNPVSLTIPVDCTAMYLLWGYWENSGNNNGVDEALTTLGGVVGDQHFKANDNVDREGGGISVWYNPSTGSVSLDITWEAAPQAFGQASWMALYVKDGDLNAWRDVDGNIAPTQGSAVSATVTSEVTDLVLAFDGRYSDVTPPSLEAGWTDHGTVNPSGSNYQRARSITGSAVSTTANAQEPSNSSIQAVSIPVAVAGPSIGSLDADAGGAPTQTTLPSGAEAANVANTDTGLVWFAVYVQGSTPTPAEIKAGTGAVGNSQSASVVGNPDVSVVTAAPFTGLEGSTNYDLWAVAEFPTDTFGAAISDGFITAPVETELRFTMQDEFGSPLLNQTGIEYALFLAPADLGGWVPGTPAFQANNGATSATGEFVLDVTGTWADGISVMCLYWQKGSPDKVSLAFEAVSLT
jgi:hypothetical protein